MTLRVPLSLEPMEAEPVNELPSGPQWQYEAEKEADDREWRAFRGRQESIAELYGV
jgi:hypothetical protein